MEESLSEALEFEEGSEGKLFELEELSLRHPLQELPLEWIDLLEVIIIPLHPQHILLLAWSLRNRYRTNRFFLV